MTIKMVKDKDDGFWPLMGPMFASAEVRRSLGVSMSSDDSYSWVVGMSKSKLVGFCAVTPDKSGVRLRHLYVNPDKRGSGFGSQLIRRVVSDFAQTPIIVWAKSDMCGFYERFGFVSSGKSRGRYSEMVRS